MSKEDKITELWISKEYKSEYIDSAPASGISVKLQNGLTDEIVADLKALIAFLRRHYYFPIRCNITVSNHYVYRSPVDGHRYYGIFYDNENLYPKRLIYPQISVCGKSRTNSGDEVIMILLHELSHYYQWYFKEDTRRTNRSLEIEANKWAKYILYLFREQNQDY